jgi:hypothetical protein
VIAHLANHLEASVWRSRLETALMAAIADAKPDMDWAVDNCTFWPADIIRAALGYDPVEPGWRGSFTDRASCMRRLIAAGGLGALIARAADRHGWLQCDPDAAQVGDVGIAILPTPYGVSMPSVLICRATGWFVGRSESGTVMLRHDADHPRVNVCWNILP